MDAPLGPVLIALARHAIATRLGLDAPPPREHPALATPGASFVTLTAGGALRGCIGQLEAVRALGEDVRANALAAAFADPRFMPLTVAEWPAIRVEVSVLGAVEFLACPTEEDCLRLITPGVDGVVLASGRRRATFLPQVWAQLPDPQEFIEHLLRKAGLPVGGWPADMELGLYHVDEYREAP